MLLREFKINQNNFQEIRNRLFALRLRTSCSITQGNYLSIMNTSNDVEIKCQLDATDDFYCRSYCLLNMFRSPLCPSSGAREYYTDGCCLWYLVLWFSSCRYGVELKVTFSSTPYRQLENQSTKYHRQQPSV